MNNINVFLDMIAESLFGITRTAAFEQQICVDCKGPAKEFTDEKSAKEYTHSALCQSCQDKIFEGDE